MDVNLIKLVLMELVYLAQFLIVSFVQPLMQMNVIYANLAIFLINLPN